MTQAERRELMSYHANLIRLYLVGPPGDPTSKSQLEANRNNIIASVARLAELSIQLQP